MFAAVSDIRSVMLIRGVVVPVFNIQMMCHYQDPGVKPIQPFLSACLNETVALM